jgi:hypothetical protein
MIFQVGDMLKYDNKYDAENKGIAIVVKVYEENTTIRAVRTYDLLYLSRSWQGEGQEDEDFVKGYRDWQIEDGSWSKIG